MRKYLLSLPFAALAATFAFMYFNMSESEGVPLNSENESIVGTLFWGSFIACQLTIPIISKRSMILGYLALSIPYCLFLLTGALL
jgi:hypothetical protein